MSETRMNDSKMSVNNNTGFGCICEISQIMNFIEPI